MWGEGGGSSTTHEGPSQAALASKLDRAFELVLSHLLTTTNIKSCIICQTLDTPTMQSFLFRLFVQSPRDPIVMHVIKET